ncbi:MAG: hypothetical protein CM15mP84_02440 [Cellvibrionales bacterium]|nr:MAG: hypothetical protein CM15mP84_02440 [Cellvibrionales bacterium]
MESSPEGKTVLSRISALPAVIKKHRHRTELFRAGDSASLTQPKGAYFSQQDVSIKHISTTCRHRGICLSCDYEK